MARVSVKAADGGWQGLGEGRFHGIHPEGLVASADRWGPSQASFTLGRPIDDLHPDLHAYTRLAIEDQGRAVWGGRIADHPGSEQLTVQAEGAQSYLDDQRLERVWVRSNLDGWKDIRSAHDVGLSGHELGAGVVVNEGGSIVIGWPQAAQVTAPTDLMCGVFLDLGPVASEIKYMVIDYKVKSAYGLLGWPAFFTLYIQNLANGAFDTAGGSESYGWTFPSLGAHNATGQRAVTFTTSRQYVRMVIVFDHNATSGDFNMPSDYMLQLTGVRCFRDPAHQVDGASTLKPKTVLADALAKAPTLIQDGLGVEDIGSALSDFGTNDGSETPRRIWERLDDYVKQTKKVDASFRPIFKNRITVPQLVVSDPDVFRDTSTGSGKELFNEVTVIGEQANGIPLRLTRLASQLTDYVPSLLDRASLIRSYELKVEHPTTLTEMQALADSFLRTHRATPFTGEVIASYGTVRWLKGGHALSPSELLLHTDEPILLSELIDPDTGSKGRIGIIDSVDWEEASDTATVHIGMTRQDHEALMVSMEPKLMNR